MGPAEIASIIGGVDKALDIFGVGGEVRRFWDLAKAQLPAIVTDAEQGVKIVSGLVAKVMGWVTEAKVPSQADWDKAIATTADMAARLQAQVKPIPPGA